MTLDSFASLLLATGIGLGMTALTYLLARKSGILPVQISLIKTLQDNGEAMAQKLTLLTEELGVQKDLRMKLEKRVGRLQAVLIEVIEENSDLRKRLGLPVKRSSHLDDAIENFGGEDYDGSV